jgi:tripartite ATP-independent transporter DctM subunit
VEWWLFILILIGGLLALLAIGLPIAFAFLLVNFAGAFFIMGGISGLNSATQQIFTGLTSFALAPIPLFVLLGELMLHSGMATRTFDVLDKWVGRLPGRLSLMVIGGGALFATLSGSTIASTAMLGEIMVPEMKARGYKKIMILGPIIGVGGLAMLIPPSALAVVYASLAQISVGKVLIGGAIPGVMLAVFYSLYVILRAVMDPTLAPAYDVAHHPLREKVTGLVKYVLPLGIIFFLVLGVIFLGVATPTEAAATGALGAFVLAAIYGRLTFQVIQKSVNGALRVTVMAFLIIGASQTYSGLLAYTGATRELVNLINAIHLSPLVTLIFMMLILLILGTFMEQVSMMMITIPVYMPIVQALHFDPIWFAIVMLLNLEMAMSTPPFGLLLFVMKGVAPAGTSMGDIIKSGIPFLMCDLMVMIILIAFPPIVLFLPQFM